MIDYRNTITELINAQIQTLIHSSEEKEAYYKGYKIYVSNEQQVVNVEMQEKNAIYLIIRFMSATTNFGQVIMPITISAVAENNKNEVCQTLLYEYALTYNLALNDDKTIKQTYTTPEITSNFNEVYTGFRSLFMMTGTFLISTNSNPYEIVWENDTLECITSGIVFDNSLDSQVFYGSNDFTVSKARMGTLAVNMTTYVMDNDFMNETLKVLNKEINIDTEFTFTIKFKNNVVFNNVSMKLVNFSIQQNIGEMPIASLTFTN